MREWHFSQNKLWCKSHVKANATARLRKSMSKVASENHGTWEVWFFWWIFAIP